MSTPIDYNNKKLNLFAFQGRVNPFAELQAYNVRIHSSMGKSILQWEQNFHGQIHSSMGTFIIQWTNPFFNGNIRYSMDEFILQWANPFFQWTNLFINGQI